MNPFYGTITNLGSAAGAAGRVNPMGQPPRGGSWRGGPPSGDPSAAVSAAGGIKPPGPTWGSPPASGPAAGGGAPGVNTGAPPKGREGVLSGPGTGEDWYKTYGKGLTETPGYGEELYKQGVGALNPYYDNAQKEMVREVNNATAARGGFNSSYAINRIARGTESLRGQQARDMAQMAAEADRERLGRMGAGFGAASGAQGLTDSRVQKAVDDAIRLAGGKAGQVGGFYGNIQHGYDAATMASIEANLKASGMSAAEIQSVVNTLMQGASIGVKAAAL
jgi:hypothetical protein